MIVTTRQQRRLLKKENAKLSDKFEPIPSSQWPIAPWMTKPPNAVWRNRDYLVQVFSEEGPAEIRLSVCRAVMGDDGRWKQGIPWEDLQGIKSALGYGHVFAVEIYPPDYDVVNAGNMRHLWLMRNPPAIGWRNK